MSIQVYRDRYMPLLDAELRAALDANGRTVPFYDMMRYHMGWLDVDLRPVQAPAGKRLRPLLCMLICEAVGGCVEHTLPAAAAIELVHNFSLIHDDIEDDSDTRRHRTTLWKLWGMPHGINCGDGMFSAALCCARRFCSPDIMSRLLLGDSSCTTSEGAVSPGRVQLARSAWCSESMMPSPSSRCVAGSASRCHST